MAETQSTMLPLGTPAPDFNLLDPVAGQIRSRDELAAGRPLMVAILCNHCPYVKHIADGLAGLARDYHGDRVSFVGISSNDVRSHPGDSPERMVEESTRRGYIFPYLYDETQEVAAAFHAACTPEFYLFDASHKLVYRGQFDAARPGNSIPVTGDDLRRAIDAVLEHRPVAENQTPSIGCNVKWKGGRAPY